MRVILFVSLLLFSLASLAFQQQTLKIAAPHETKALPSLVESIKKAYQSIGIQIDIIYLPAKRSLVEAQKNTWVDGELVRINMGDNLLPDFIKVPVKLMDVELAAYSIKEHVVFNGWDSLKNYKLSSMRGLVYVEGLLQTHQLKKNTHLVTNATQAFKLLTSNRVDIVLMPKLIADHVLTLNKFENISEHILEAEPVFHYVHKKH